MRNEIGPGLAHLIEGAKVASERLPGFTFGARQVWIDGWPVYEVFGAYDADEYTLRIASPVVDEGDVRFIAMAFASVATSLIRRRLVGD